MAITRIRVGEKDKGLNYKQKCQTCGKEAAVLVVNQANLKGQCAECNPRDHVGFSEDSKSANLA